MHFRPPFAKDTPTASRWGVLWLVLALLFAQSWGSLHRIAHNPGAHTHHGHTAYDQDDHAHSPAEGLALLFDHDSESNDCRLTDGAALFDSLIIAHSQLFIAPVAILLIAFSQVTATARASELFEARGPPPTR